MNIQDTGKIQLASVKNFLQELDYSYFNIDKGFYCAYPSAKARCWISLSTAVKLHNNCYAENHGNGFEPDCPFGDIPVEWVRKAIKAKIVHAVYLQLTKHKRIIVQKHLVKFVNQNHADLFIKGD